ncbi:glycosyltransferase family 2 protein [Kineococcus sp. NPDC059986]|uniref:glycosyltransferase family 2 protein n=1 Tax=Kineococcus sp. NPDC059986 TaxID=3155538 RepID=UPI00344CA772
MAEAHAFVTASYIVKDEEELLGASLAAVTPFVDEIVVYDTGSTDATTTIAREHGARVVEGYWDDDFGAARNRALEHCTGEWVLSVDADEVVHGDPRAFRRSLHLATTDSFALEVVSSSYADGGAEHRAMVARVLRRSHCRFEGMLHEMIVGRWGQLSQAQNSTIFLRHYGYTDVYMKERNKGARNLALAEAALAKARSRSRDVAPDLVINVARSATLAGDHAKAMATFASLDLDRLPEGSGLIAGPTVLVSALATDDLVTARRWIDRMESWGESKHVCAAMRAQVLMAEKDWEGAETLLRGLEDDVQRTSAQFRADAYTDQLITCIARQGRGAEAADLLLSHVASGRSGISPVSAVLLVGETPDGARRLAAALPDALVKPFLAQLQTVRAEVTGEFCEALWGRDGHRPALLAAVAKQWPSLTVEDALKWSLRLREAGLEDLCPLRRIATAVGRRDTLTRIVCAGILHEIGEQQFTPVLEAMLAVVPDAQVDTVLTSLRPYAPTLTASLVHA